MEKKTPRCPLPVIKALIEADRLRTTHSARVVANALWFDFAEMQAVIARLKPADYVGRLTALGEGFP